MGEFQASVLVAFPVPGLLRLLLWQRRINFDYRATATAHNKSAHAFAEWMISSAYNWCGAKLVSDTNTLSPSFLSVSTPAYYWSEHCQL